MSRDPLVYTVGEAAPLLNLSKAQLYRLIHTGAVLTVPNMGGRMLVSRKWVDRQVAAADPEHEALEREADSLRALVAEAKATVGMVIQQLADIEKAMAEVPA